MKYKKRYYTHEQFLTDINKLAQKIKDYEKLNKIKFEAIYGIPRGGLIPAVYLSHLLDINLIFDEKKIDKKVLVVDEINDTGKTMAIYANGFTVCLHYKPWVSIFKPDMWIRETSEWQVYPWERQMLSLHN